MTFGEIYTRVCFNLWGNSAVPAGTAAILQGENGIIANAHRKILQGDNFWFMHTWTTIDVVAGQQSYNLAPECKEIITVTMKVDGESYFTQPLSPLGLQEAHYSLWPMNNSTAKYPTFYEKTDEAITLYPAPDTNLDEALHIIYWTFIPRPPTDGFSAAYDALTDYGADAIIYKATADMAKILKEFDVASVYNADFQEELELLRNESRRRMQANLYEVKYQGI